MFVICSCVFISQQLEKDVDNLIAHGQADYKVALRFAFEKFVEASDI